MAHSHRFLLTFLISSMGLLSANAQLILRTGGTFLNGKDIKKIIITYDDHTIWALTTSGEVYYKPKLATDFSVFAPIIGEQVDDLAGYSLNDIYFSVKPKKLIQVKNSNIHIIALDDPEITMISGIAVLLDGMKNEFSFPEYDDYRRSDRLAVATDKYLYRIIRDDRTVMLYDIHRQPNFDVREFGITKSTIRGVDFTSNMNFQDRCGWEPGKSVVHHNRFGSYISVIPQHEPYGEIICTSFNYGNYNLSVDVGSAQNREYWGTKNGLYVKTPAHCIFDSKQLISNEQINSIEDLRMLNILSPTVFVIAASNTGLFYTENFVSGEGTWYLPIDEIKFKKLPGLACKVRNFAIDYESNRPAGIRPLYDPDRVCEREIWLATDEGVKRLYPQLENTIYQDKRFSFINFDKTPGSDNNEESSFMLCGNENLTADISLGDIPNSAISIHWTKDGIDVAEWAEKRIIEISDEGIYMAELISVCEGIRLRSKSFVVKKGTIPEIKFNYPNEINLCEGETTELSTVDKPGYTYRWFKNQNQISGARSSKFQVTSEGQYHVEVSSCAGSFIKSSVVKINIPVLQAPIISADKSSYCFGDMVLLKVENNQGYKIHWYKDGMEMIGMNDKTEISTSLPGRYEVSIENLNGCKKKSQQFNLTINSLPAVSINVTPLKTLCYGESTRLTASLIPNATYKWNTGETTSSINVNQSGNYFVDVTSSFGCKITSDIVKVSIGSQIVLAKPADYKLCTIANEKIVLMADPGYTSYSWNGMLTINNTYTVSKPGDYKLTVTDANGCEAKVTYTVIPWCKEIIIVNAFSPNGDGINEIWKVSGLENEPDATISIHNRYGALVFQTKGKNPVWDGRYNGADAPAGVYYYQIISTKSVKPLNGSITLIR